MAFFVEFQAKIIENEMGKPFLLMLKILLDAKIQIRFHSESKTHE